MAKWPGGNFVSSYDFLRRSGRSEISVRRAPNRWWSPNDVGLSRVHRLLPASRGRTRSYDQQRIWMSAGDAAQQVEYCNGSINTRLGKLRSQNGSPEPFNIRYWTIGNEMYGPWQAGHMPLEPVLGETQ